MSVSAPSVLRIVSLWYSRLSVVLLQTPLSSCIYASLLLPTKRVAPPPHLPLLHLPPPPSPTSRPWILGRWGEEVDRKRQISPGLIGWNISLLYSLWLPLWLTLMIFHALLKLRIPILGPLWGGHSGGFLEDPRDMSLSSAPSSGSLTLRLSQLQWQTPSWLGLRKSAQHWGVHSTLRELLDSCNIRP